MKIEGLRENSNLDAYGLWNDLYHGPACLIRLDGTKEYLPEIDLGGSTHGGIPYSGIPGPPFDFLLTDDQDIELVYEGVAKLADSVPRCQRQVAILQKFVFATPDWYGLLIPLSGTSPNCRVLLFGTSDFDGLSETTIYDCVDFDEEFKLGKLIFTNHSP